MDNVIIESKRSVTKYKNTLIFIYVIAIGSAIIFAIAMGNDSASNVPSYREIINPGSTSQAFSRTFWYSLFLWLLFFSLPFSVIPHLLLHKIYERQKVIVYTDSVLCKFGIKSEMTIPINAITSVTTTSGFLSAVTITCAGNRYTISYIDNRQEIYNAINKQIAINKTDFQKDSISHIESHKINDNIDEQKLKKYKKMFDDGLITEEEYQLLKKQILKLS